MSTASKSSTKVLIQWVIVFALMFGVGFLPPFGQLTPTGMRAMGIFVGIVYGWTVLGIIKPTLLAILAYGLIIGFPAFVQASLGTPMVGMLLLLFPICGLLNKYNVIDTLARKFVTNSFCEGHPWRLCFMLLFGAYVCVNIQVVVAAVLFTEFMRSICRISNIKTPSKFSISMMIGIALSLMVGQLMLPIHGVPLVLLGSLQATTGMTVNYAKYMLLIIPLAIILIIAYLLVMRFVLRVDVEPLKAVTIESLGGRATFTKDQRTSLMIMVFLIIALVAAVGTPKSAGAAYALLNQKLGLFGICMIMACILIFLKNSEGKPLFNFGECANLGMQWDPFFLVMFIVPFSSFLTSPATGVAPTIAGLMKPFFSLSPFMFMIAIYLIIAILTNFAQNTVLILITIPLFMAYGQATGFDMSGYYILLFMVAQLALGSPGSSTICGIMYSASDLVNTKSVMKTAFTALPFLFLIAMLIGLPMATFIF